MENRLKNHFNFLYYEKAENSCWNLFFVIACDTLQSQISWTPCNQVNTQMLFCIQCLNDSTAWATGERGLVCKPTIEVFLGQTGLT